MVDDREPGARFVPVDRGQIDEEIAGKLIAQKFEQNNDLISRYVKSGPIIRRPDGNLRKFFLQGCREIGGSSQGRKTKERSSA